ncbi:MAG: phage tail tape measure protein [Comamonas sp.]
MSDTRLRLILELRDRVLAPLRGIQSGSKDAAAALKSTRDQLRDLEKAQQDIDGLRKTRVQLRGQQRDLQDLQTKLAGSNASLVEHRERHKNIAASLKTARESHSKLTKALQDGATATPEFSRQLEMARIRLLSSQTAYERSNSTLSKYRTQIKTTEAGIAQLSGKIDNGKDRLIGYQQRLERAGISTDKLGQQSRNQKIQIEAATAAMERQKQALAGLKAQQDKLATLKEGHAKAMMHTGMVAGAGVAMVAAGRTVAKPVQATLGAFSQQEDASTQLRAAMMQSDGSVQAEFAQIDALAKRLGDRLPGTTADFIEMMTVLRKEGISAQAILGGTGEAAALLGVQLKMPVTAAAAFAAKMQDATQATEGEMLGLMDVLQKNAYLGADQNYQLNGITAMAGAMGLLRLKGEEAYKALSPMLVMMNQAGMTDGGSAGNAINKVFEAGLDTKKLKKVNELLKQSKTGIKLDFADKGGKFAGVENFFAQLEKLKKLGENDVLKTDVFKELFGTDKENRQVLNNFIAKGYEGYKETVAKMDAQASLQQRVNEQLGTLSNVMEAAQGGFTNVMADIGDTIKGDAKDIIKAVGDITSSVGGWIKEHPALTAGIARSVAVLAGLMVVLGALLVPLALIAGKFMLMRFLFGMIGIKVPMLSAGISALTGVVSKLTGALFSGLMVALRATMSVIVKLGVALLTTPVGWFVLAIAAIAGAAYLIYKNWGAISSFFAGLWSSVKTQTAAAWTSIKASLSGLWSTTVNTAQTIWAGLPGFFAGMWQGIKDTASAVWTGIASTLSQIWAVMVSTASTLWQQMGGSLPAVLQTISTAIINWSPLGLFYQAFAGVMSYFGVELPTKFSEFGANIIQGLVNGITSKLAMVRDAVGGAADSAIGWFKEKLGIHSPSRVFMAAGVNVGEGAAIGIDSTLGMVRQSAAAMAAVTGMTLAMPAVAGGMTSPALADPVQIDRRAPLMQQAPVGQRPATIVQGDTITIQIHAAPGMDPQALAREVERLMEQRDRSKANRLQNSFSDWRN